MDFQISQSLSEVSLSTTKGRVGRVTPLFALAQYDRPHRNHIADPPNAVPQPSPSPKRLADSVLQTCAGVGLAESRLYGGSINLLWVYKNLVGSATLLVTCLVSSDHRFLEDGLFRARC